ncbi:nuclear pore complex protein Nup153 isoform X3 [Betta splendens]|uniref:Nuclear pore complex protein Nup153 n=1 Tax=Betta splendens TaxID=158456 RepID=A0A6P7NRJ1_BETSP|nr:nuclear pore complex protein Nup153 isoform X3 [Betta splendens]
MLLWSGPLCWMTAIRRRIADSQSDERAMAATGGGKIRSRRYHIASKPYAKSKQQSGLISRVTDTVKSIVPSWLQKYFKNEDNSEEGGSVQGTEQNCQPPLPPNGSEEGPPALDGRDSPEPGTSFTEPSTSRASLNIQEYVLSRPPLSRSHLHFPSLDPSSPSLGTSSSLFSQPSTSSAPGPFSTGFSLVKEIKDNLSQHEDDNISTTSGFSSRASDKDVPTSKTASLPQLWCPDMERTNSGPQPSQSTLKKPTFNLSVFGTSSNSSLNSTVLNSSQLGDSPFYPGKTTYGGAAAARSSRARPGTPYHAPVRRQIKAKPAGAQPCGVTSATARRILQSLESMSSPLADAKRIPAASSMAPSVDGTNLDVSHFQSKKKRMDPGLPPVQKLVVPTTTPGNRSVSFRPTLTPGGVSRTLERTPRETPTRQLHQLPNATPSPSQSTMTSSRPVYPLSSTPAASSTSSGGGKMKRERTSARPTSKRPEEDEVASVPDLPKISLPISNAALPTFSFSSPLPSLTTISTTPVTDTTPVKENPTKKDSLVALTPPCAPFTFSSPIVKATAASPPSFSPSAGFTFSAPVAKIGPSMSNGKLASSLPAAVKPTAVKSTEDFEGPFKPAKVLKEGSVLDLLKTPGFASPVARTSPGPDASPQKISTRSTTPLTSTTSSLSSSAGCGDLFKVAPGWSCDVCLVQNKPTDTKCVCCTAPQPSTSPKSMNNKPSPATSAAVASSMNSTSITTTTTGFGAVVSKPPGTWDCDTCLVQNKPDAVKCVACETAKPGTGLKPSLTLPSAFSAVNALPTNKLGFGDKFKKPEGAWECDTCMVQNKAEDTRCVACTSTKPGASAGAPAAFCSPATTESVFGIGDKFKKPEGAWECEVCLVQNKAADVQCVACQASKPGAKLEPKAFGSSAVGTTGSSATSSGGFKFGTSDSTSESTSGGFKFGIPDSTSGSGGFKFGTSDSTSGSADFKFGGSFSESSSSLGGFKFGVPFGNSSSETTSKDTTAPSGFKFGSSSDGFKFGAASSDDKKSDPAAGSGFQFGASSGPVFGTGLSSTENSSKGGFSFGMSKPEEKTPDTTTITTSSVSFTPLSASQEKSDSAKSLNETTSTNTNATSTSSIFGRLGEPNLSATTPQSSTTFRSLQADKAPAAPTFTFGKPEEKKETSTVPAPSTLLFGAASKEAEATPVPAISGGFAFNKPTAPTEQPPPAFTFGKPADKGEAAAAEAPKPSFTFGQTATESAAPKPAFTFLANNPTSTTNSTTSTSSTSAPSLFGASSSSTQSLAPSAAPSAFVFGQSAAAPSDAAPSKTFVFGQSQDNQTSASSAAPLNSAPASAQPFIFGAPASAAPAPAAPSFSFGATAPSAASSSVTAPSTAPPPFVFSSAPSSGFGAGQTPSFGASFGSGFTASPSQAPAFGAKTNAAPVFGQQTSSATVFGAAANAAPGGGFQFGVTSAFGATNNTSGVFTFGAGSAPSPAPIANPSIAPQPGGPGGGFNFAQPPTFNIGSTKSFPATPAAQQAIAGRKIKMAVRRRK